MAKRNWNKVMNDLFLLILGIQDTSLLSENMVIAAESLGLGSCFIGDTPYYANEIIQNYKLPKRVFPLVQLVMGYPAEDPPIRPRYPLHFTLFESEYPRLEEDVIMNAMRVMDEGFLNQDYYRRHKAKIPLEVDREESYD
jgi:FMN reductase (NADPH)